MNNQSLLQELMKSAGLSQEQAAKALAIVASFAKERFPILEGTINSYVKQEFKSIDPDMLTSILDN